MPFIGDIKKGPEIGRKSLHKFIWAACERCGKQRWALLVNGKALQRYCRHCNQGRFRKGPNHHLWTNGRIDGGCGYMKQLVRPNDSFYAMADKQGYVREHRLVMAKHLGRCLLPTEFVHHKNGVRDDNRLENLELISRLNHDIYTKLCKHCELRKELRLLRWQVKELAQVLQEQLAMKETKMENSIGLISPEWRQQGLSLHEPDDHILELRLHKKVIARFSQTGVTVENILKVGQQALRGREN